MEQWGGKEKDKAKSKLFQVILSELKAKHKT